MGRNASSSPGSGPGAVPLRRRGRRALVYPKAQPASPKGCPAPWTSIESPVGQSSLVSRSRVCGAVPPTVKRSARWARCQTRGAAHRRSDARPRAPCANTWMAGYVQPSDRLGCKLSQTPGFMLCSPRSQNSVKSAPDRRTSVKRRRVSARGSDGFLDGISRTNPLARRVFDSGTVKRCAPAWRRSFF
jgi:hypothetical protein